MSITTHPDLGTPEPVNQAVRKTRQTSAKRRQQDLADAQDGLALAKAWLETAHPYQIHALLGRVGENYDWTKKVWHAIPLEHRDLQAQFQARGQKYWQAFIAEIRRHWCHARRVWVSVMYQKGIDDGRRWAAEVAPPELVARLRQAFEEAPLTILPASRPSDEYEGFPSPAHKLVVTLLGDAYPRLPCPDEDYLPDIDADCKEFREFWQPFVDEPIDHIQAADAFDTSKLNDPNYVSGFIDGACGQSAALAAKFALGCK